MRWPRTSRVSLPSIARTAALTSSGSVDSLTSASCASRTTPAAPPAIQAGAVWRPIPPCAQIGTSSSDTSRWSRTNVPSSPTRPPLSLPLATMPSAPRATAARASSVDTTCTSTVRGCHGSTGAPAGRTTSETSSGSEPGWNSTPSGMRTPNPSGSVPASRFSARSAAARSRPTSSTPKAPAHAAAATTRASGRSNALQQRTDWVRLFEIGPPQEPPGTAHDALSIGRLVPPRDSAAALASGGLGFRRIAVPERAGPRFLERLERRPQERADAPRLVDQPLTLGSSVAHNGARLAVRLVEDQLRLALGLVLQLVGGALGRDERRPKQCLQFPVASELGLELLDLVEEIGSLAPDVLETVGDVEHQPVDVGDAVAAEEPAARDRDVTELDGGECHEGLLETR